MWLLLLLLSFQKSLQLSDSRLLLVDSRLLQTVFLSENHFAKKKLRVQSFQMSAKTMNAYILYILW